jgi:hypothetical protein
LRRYANNALSQGQPLLKGRAADRCNPLLAAGFNLRPLLRFLYRAPGRLPPWFAAASATRRLASRFLTADFLGCNSYAKSNPIPSPLFQIECTVMSGVKVPEGSK